MALQDTEKQDKALLLGEHAEYGLHYFLGQPNEEIADPMADGEINYRRVLKPLPPEQHPLLRSR